MCIRDSSQLDQYRILQPSGRGGRAAGFRRTRKTVLAQPNGRSLQAGFRGSQGRGGGLRYARRALLRQYMQLAYCTGEEELQSKDECDEERQAARVRKPKERAAQDCALGLISLVHEQLRKGRAAPSARELRIDLGF